MRRGSATEVRRDESSRALVLATTAMLVVRLLFVAFSPDVDADAYGHLAIARELLRDPKHLAAHWVWLPLFHYLEWALLKLGFGLRGIRALDALLACGAPFLLRRLLVRDERTLAASDPETREVADLAAILFAVCSLWNQLGTSALSETLFTTLVLAALLLLAPRGKNEPFSAWRAFAAAVPLTLASLLRYEAWVVDGAIAAYGAWAITRSDRRARGLDAVLAVVPAVIAIAWWVRVRWGGDLFAAIRATRAFTYEKLGGSPRSVFEVVKDLVRYPLWLPTFVFGPAILVAPFGVRRFLARTPRIAVVVALVLLAFLTASWLRRATLGLERHVVVLLPFFAATLAHGAFVVRERWRRLEPRHLVGLVAIYAVVFLAVRGAIWRTRGEEQREAAAFLRSHAGDARVLCDEPMIEVLSDLPPDRVSHRWVSDVTPDEARALADPRGLEVATMESRAVAIAPMGSLLARWPITVDGRADAIVILRIEPK